MQSPLPLLRRVVRSARRVGRRRVGLPAALILVGMAGVATAEPMHGIAMHGTPALPPGFAHFPYANPEAPKGGRLALGALGSFDSLNPFIVRGVAPQGLREYVFESLLARSQDEPFTLYGLIAERIEVPEDRSSITFHLNPAARFSDGQPIGPADVLFSHALLRDKGLPNLRSYYRKVARAEAVGGAAVRFTFEAAGDREIPLILGLMPILPKHRLDAEAFERTSLEPPVGSGPYRVAAVDAGRRVVYRRNEDHWARDLPVYRGRHNFAEVRIDYFRDSSALLEAFRTGEIDVRAEDDPSRWAEGYAGSAGPGARIVRREFETGLPAGMSAFVFNTRRPTFADPRIRRALILLFDFEWVNQNLYHGLYQRTESYFQRSTLSSVGRPADARERQLLAPFPEAVKSQVLEGRSTVPSASGSAAMRDRLQEALVLLGEAGYVLREDRMVDAKTGARLTFEFLAARKSQERLMLSFADTLRRLGLEVRIRQTDQQQYWRRIRTFDFDMTHFIWSGSLSPGNEQAHRWSSRAADTPFSFNFAGVRNPAADVMIEALLAAETREDFASAVRALDRVLLSGDYVIPLFHAPKQWMAHWSRVQPPARTALFGADFDTWWAEPGQ